MNEADDSDCDQLEERVIDRTRQFHQDMANETSTVSVRQAEPVGGCPPAREHKSGEAERNHRPIQGACPPLSTSPVEEQCRGGQDDQPTCMAREKRGERREAAPGTAEKSAGRPLDLGERQSSVQNRAPQNQISKKDPPRRDTQR